MEKLPLEEDTSATLFSSYSYEYQTADWPWVWALREGLDWTEGLDPSEIEVIQAGRRRNLPAQVTSNLWIGNVLSVLNAQRLKDLGITHVLNLTGDSISADLPAEYRDSICTALHGYPMLDKHLKEAHDFFSSARDGQCIVHCVAGYNRSGLIAAALAMLESNWTVLETVQYLRQKRDPRVLTNESFQEQLVAFARQRNLLGTKPGETGSLVLQTAPPESERIPPDNEEEEEEWE